MIHYFAYGSNLHPVRLRERVPSAKLLCVSDLRSYRLAFNKRSHDGSGKCHLQYTGSNGDRVHGAVYQIHPEHKNRLDELEGKGKGYIDRPATLIYQGCEYDCFTYHAQASHIDDNLKPYHWYKQLVFLGAKYLQFPASYQAIIESIKSIDDSHEKRRKKHEYLIERIIKSHQ